MNALQVLDALASVLTAAVALVFWVQLQLAKHDQRRRLETYLAEECVPSEPGQQGARSLTHLVAQLGMSESDVMNAAFRSPKIRRLVRRDPATSIATDVMLAYERDPPRRS